MQQILRSIIVFGAVCIGAIFVIQNIIDRSYRSTANHKIAKLIRHEIDAEIMVFGSSVARMDIDPRIISGITNQTAYNMGWDGTFFIQYEGLLREFLSYTKKCKTIVIACETESFGKNDLITRPDLYYAFLDNDHVYSSLARIEPNNMRLAKYIPGYKMTLYNKNFYNELFVAPLYREKDIGNGYWPSEHQFDTLNFKPFSGAYQEDIYHRIQTLLAEIAGRGIKVYLAFTPIHTLGQEKILNLSFIREKYKHLAGGNIHFLDYNTDSMLCNNLSYYSNFSHLNETGARVFSEKLANDIKRSQ